MTSKCIARNFGQDSVVCECNSTYCDSVGSVTLPPVGHFSSYLSSMSGSRLEASQGQVQVNSTTEGEWRWWRALMSQGCWNGPVASLLPSCPPGLRLTIDMHQKYQKIKGFGGAMTDAAAINILSLSAATQDQLLRQYFSAEGTTFKKKTAS